MVKRRKYQFGGEETDFFNRLLDLYDAQQQQEEDPTYIMPDDGEEVDFQYDEEATDSDEYMALQEQYAELQAQNEALSQQILRSSDTSWGDNFLDFLFKDDQKMPVDFSNFSESTGSGSYTTKEGVSLSDLSGNARSLLNKLSGRAGEFVVTSGKRSSGSNEAVGGVKNSFHLTGDAIDLRPTPELDRFFTSNEGRQWLSAQGYEVIDERNRQGHGAHWHLEPKGKPTSSTSSRPRGQRYKFGGAKVASSLAEKTQGLNNSAFDEMFFPMEGQNVFRGLDNGQPVQLRDEFGNTKVLNSKHETAVMQGNVYEQRMQFGGGLRNTSPQFEKWYSKNTREGLNNIPSNDPNHSFDYQSYFQDMMQGKAAYVDPTSDDHYFDTYKFPNHPSFSTESKYFTSIEEQPNALSYTGEFKKKRRAEDMPLGRFY